jgi:acetyl-CoA C-acetyltransferase
LSEVGIVTGICGKFRKNSSTSLLDLACEPCVSIFKQYPDLKDEIDCVLFSTTSDIQYGSTILSEYLGIKSNISQRIDNLCNSGTNAIISGYSFVKAGLCETVLVVGADLKNTQGKRLNWDVTRGQFPFPVHWASLFAKSHMRKFGTTEEQMASVAVKNCNNAMKNPSAIHSKGITLDEVLQSKKIAGPIKLMDCSYVCDGASAVVIANKEKAKKFTDNPVWIRGIGSYVSSASFSGISDDLSSLKSAKIAARRAYDMAEVRPTDLDVVEVHDAFTIMEIISYEDLDLVAKGKGGEYVTNGNTMTNTRGGLLGSGHPLGATGIAQTVEIVEQLTGSAQGRQVQTPHRLGLVHNLAAAGSSAAIIILGGEH